jgi:hypothetical protein
MRSRVLALVSVCLFALPVPKTSAQPVAEIGSSLTSVMFHSDKYSDSTMVGVPSATFGLIDPGVYGSFFLGPNAAIEPRVGLLWASSSGHSDHVVSAAVQFDYFVAGTAKRSPFVFAGGGISDTSGSSVNPKSVSAGGGMRLPAGDRLVFRLDARYTHFTDNGGNSFTVGFAIGGVFLRQ